MHLNQANNNFSFTLDRVTRNRTLQVFWTIAFGLCIYELFLINTASILSNYGAILITIAALFPTYLWLSGKALGMPIFPLFGITFIWTYSLPLINSSPAINQYSPTQHFTAGVVISGSLVLATFVWLQFVQRPPLPPKSYRTIQSDTGAKFFVFCLGLGVLFNLYTLAGWIVLDGGTFSLIRSITLALNALSTFALAYRFGARDLTNQQSQWFIFLITTSLIVDSAGLLLVGSASTFLLAMTAFSIGRKKIPVKTALIVLLCLTFLHYGKAEMRNKYWFDRENKVVQPWQYPSWYAEWIGYSVDYFSRSSNLTLSKPKEKQSFLERSSVVQLFLLVQDKSPQSIPYLNGATYSIIPELLIPRFLTTSKIASHEGTYLLNIHYGKQTRKDTRTTTIGWGLLAESYANFGELGCFGLAIFLGILYGQVSKWTINAPLFSDRSLFGVIMVSFSFQSEFSAGVYVAALFQYSVTLGGVILVFMKATPNDSRKFIGR